MIVGVLRVELYMPYARSLKEKRKVLRSIKDRLRGSFNVSVSEVDNHDLWQRASLGISVTGSDYAHLQEIVDRMLEFLERYWSHLILEVSSDFFKV